MIDVETDVFNYVYPYVSSLVPTGCFKSVYVPEPAKFPFAILMEIDNYTDKKNRSSARNEDYVVLTYEANVYARDRFSARSVMNGISQGMNDLGFTRLSMQSVPNLADSTIYRIVARYTAEVDQNKVVYRRG